MLWSLFKLTWAVQSAADAAGLKEARELIARNELSDLREALKEATKQVRTLVLETHSMVQIFARRILSNYLSPFP